VAESFLARLTFKSADDPRLFYAIGWRRNVRVNDRLGTPVNVSDAARRLIDLA
jgi:hypothetical protein